PKQRPQHPGKARSLLFKGVLESSAKTSASASCNASSVTTPLAKPTADSPQNTSGKSDSRTGDLKNGLDDVQRLPPPVLMSGTANTDSETMYSDSESRRTSHMSMQSRHFSQENDRPDNLPESSSLPAT